MLPLRHTLVVVCFSGDGTSLKDRVCLKEDGVGGSEEPFACARWTVWGVLYTDDAGAASKSAGLAKMVTGVMAMFKAALSGETGIGLL